jgi:quercetin dioxygenase-like cupin family protein
MENDHMISSQNGLTGPTRVLVVTAFLLTGTLGFAQQQGGRGGFSSNFTGDIAIVDSSEMRSSRIRFEAGARTNWHIHSERQLILIEEGQGRVQEMGGPVQVLLEGVPYYTQANVPHWHGADPEQAAVQFSVYTGSLDWQQAVTDAEYLGQ